MKKYVGIFTTVILVMIFFFLEIIPETYVFRTTAQEKAREEWCSHSSCGLIFMMTPYEYVKTSVYNLVVQD